MSRLADARSAYLRAAAHQPVPWYPWGEAAFRAARELDRPILLDIGAVWCHWCHVMDRESYEDPALAELLDREFVCIKVDRDERPDVDARYQRAVQALSGQGGWPLTAFLTPAGEVFFGGTYFPPDGRHGRAGFRTVLESVRAAYRDRRGEVETQAAAVRRALEAHLDESAEGPLGDALLDAAVDGMRGLFDAAHGGFGRAPKFPHPGALALLLVRWHDRREDDVRTMLDRTLGAMARGGICDQLGGGFHRYSTDAEWIVPHFEKMSHDNAELLRVYTDAYAAFGTAVYGEAARGVVAWVREVLADPAGGYAASQDADVGPEDDGDYFTWTRDEAAAALDPAELEAASAYWDIGTAGEMTHHPGKNVLFVAASVEAVAARTGRSVAETQVLLTAARARLRAARERRPAPFVDRARYAGWNAMLAGALLRAGAVLDEPWARGHALATLARLRDESPEPDAVPHAPGGVGGILDDQVQTAAAALDAYEATGDAAWLDWSAALMTRVWRDYRDADGGLLDTARDRGGEGPGDGVSEGLLAARAKPLQDAPTPAPNAVAALTALRLDELGIGGDAHERWRDRADALLRRFAGRAAELGLFAATYLLAADRALHPVTHLVVVGPPDDAVAEAMHRLALATALPRRAVQRLTPADAAARALPPALAAMLARDDRPRAYACTGTSCRAPAESVEAWMETLRTL